jgi:uncharacterized protein YndB with AHSA1/START domain
MLKKIVVVLAVLVVAFLGFVATRPATFSVERSVSITAPAPVVFALINSNKNFRRWSPFEKDPGIAATYAGPEEGVGARYAWEGNADVGKGNMTITDSTPNALVRRDLEFIEPFPARNVVTHTLHADGGTTTVTWRMEGENGFMGKLVGVVMDMDAMVGGMFAEGLANLKSLAEREAA